MGKGRRPGQGTPSSSPPGTSGLSSSPGAERCLPPAFPHSGAAAPCPAPVRQGPPPRCHTSPPGSGQRRDPPAADRKTLPESILFQAPPDACPQSGRCPPGLPPCPPAAGRAWICRFRWGLSGCLSSPCPFPPGESSAGILHRKTERPPSGSCCPPRLLSGRLSGHPSAHTISGYAPGPGPPWRTWAASRKLFSQRHRCLWRGRLPAPRHPWTGNRPAGADR